MPYDSTVAASRTAPSETAIHSARPPVRVRAHFATRQPRVADDDRGYFTADTVRRASRRWNDAAVSMSVRSKTILFTVRGFPPPVRICLLRYALAALM